MAIDDDINSLLSQRNSKKSLTSKSIDDDLSDLVSQYDTKIGVTAPEPEPSLLSKVGNLWPGFSEGAKTAGGVLKTLATGGASIAQDPQGGTDTKNLLKSMGAGISKGVYDIAKTQPGVGSALDYLAPNASKDIDDYLASIKQEAVKESPGIEEPIIPMYEPIKKLLSENFSVQNTPFAKGVKGFGKSLLKTAEGFTSPENVAYLGAIPALGGAGTAGNVGKLLTEGTFANSMLEGVGQGVQQGVQGIQNKDYEQAGMGFGQATASGVMGGLLARDLLKGMYLKPNEKIAVQESLSKKEELLPKTPREISVLDTYNPYKDRLLPERAKSLEDIPVNIEPGPYPAVDISGPDTFRPRDRVVVPEQSSNFYSDVSPKDSLQVKKKIISAGNIQKDILGPETTREVIKNIKPESQKILVDAGAKEPGAFYNFAEKKFQKEVDVTPKISLGREITKEPTGFVLENYSQPQKIIKTENFSDPLLYSSAKVEKPLNFRPKEPTGFILKEETTPEAKQTLAYQLESLKNGNSKAVLVTPGESIPTGLPKTFKILDTDVGTWLFNPMKVKAATILKKVSDGTHGEILGHIEPKSLKTTKVVAAVDPSGVEMKTSVVSPENVPKQAEILKQQFPKAEIKVGGEELANEVLNKRETPLGKDEKVRGLSKSIQESLALKGFDTDSDLPTYVVENQANKLSMAESFLKGNLENARDIAMGEAKPPAELNPIDVLIAYKDHLENIGDVESLNKLITQSSVARDLTKMGQQISMARNIKSDSTGYKIQELVDDRVKIAEKRLGEKIEKIKNIEEKKIKKVLEDNLPKVDEWVAFIESIKC